VLLSLAGRFHRLMAAHRKTTQTDTAPPNNPSALEQPKRFGVKWRIWLVCGFLIAVVVSGDAYSVWSARSDAIGQSEEGVTNLSLVLAEYTSRYIAVADLVLQEVLTELRQTDADTTAIYQERAALPIVHEYLMGRARKIPGNSVLLLFGTDGHRVNSSRSETALSPTAADRDYFMHFRENDDLGVYVSAPTQSRVTGRWTFFLSRRLIATDGQFLGVVVAAIDIEDLITFYRAVQTHDGQGVTLLRRDGVVIARYPDPQASIGTSMPPQSPWYATIARGGGTYRSPGFFGASASIVSVRPISDYPMVFDAVISEEQALRLWRIATIWQGCDTFVTVSCVIGLFGLIHALFRRQEQQSGRIEHMARHDILTGIANRRALVEMLDQRIARAHREVSSSFAVLYIDLDRFKNVNDTLGHPAGDLLLQTVAKRLRVSVREGDTVARFGGDEFAVLLADIRRPTDAADVSKRILDVISELTIETDVAAVAGNIAAGVVKVLAEPFVVQGSQIHSGGTVGIAVYGPESPDAETMLAHADMALYRAKSEGRGTYRFFTEAMDTEVRARVRVDAELREAITSEQLFLMYQPQVDVETNQIVGVEALVRWRHPERGTVGPGDFIPAAEKSGLIIPLGHWVIREACRRARLWLDAGVAPPLVAINLSGVQLKNPLTLERDIAEIVEEFDLPPGMLELELTESVLMEASREHNDFFVRLREKGYRIAIDDFGSGYSSLDYLLRYPVDRIKIAQSFITDIGIVFRNDVIVRAALGLARELGIEAVVEGVQTKTQLELLRTWGCRIVQGYYYARPQPASDVSRLLQVGVIDLACVNPVGVAIPA
jgi:diguanylate cyclase (GGDEF)-like protein